jgi:type II secretory pathway pseudopilin PulG
MAKWNGEKGVALITTLLVLMLVSALMAGAFAAIQSDLRDGATDRDQTQAYAAAHAGLEQLTSSLAQLFMTDVSPSVSQISSLTTTPPSIPGFTYSAPGSSGAPGDTSGFKIDYVDTVAPIGQPVMFPISGAPPGLFDRPWRVGHMYNQTVDVTLAGQGDAILWLPRVSPLRPD